MLLDFIFGLIIFIIVFVISKGFKYLKNKSISLKLCSMELLFSGVLFFVIDTVFILLINYIYVASRLNVFSVSLVLALLINYLDLYNLIQNIKSKNFQIKKYILSLTFLILIILEVFAFNYQSYEKYNNSYTINEKETSLITSDNEFEDKGICITKKNYITINTKDLELNNMYFDFVDCSKMVYIKVFYFQEEYKFYKEFTTNANKERYCYVNIKPLNGYESIKIEFYFDDSRDTVNTIKTDSYLKEIIVNKRFPIQINLFRMFLLSIFTSFIILFKDIIAKLRQEKKPYVGQNKLKNLIYNNSISFYEMLTIAIVSTILIIFIISTLFNVDYYYTKYSLIGDNLSNQNIYFQQFDAFIKGQLHLDIKPSEKLLHLTNPYEPDNRAGVYYLWDHAFYNGKYYSYYGVAPIFLIMMPIYFVSGYIPNIITIQLIGTILTVMFIVLALLEAIKTYSKITNPLLIVFLVVCLIFTSLSLYTVTFKYTRFAEGIYHIPFAYGIAFMFAYVFFILKGYNSCGLLKRTIYLSLAGLFIVLLVTSRPNLILTFIFMLPLLIKMLLEKKSIKEKIISLSPMIFIVFVGAIFVCLYNYKRFGKITEFGQSYQLTVTNVTTLKLNIKGIWPTFYHFYLQKATRNYDKFPFFTAYYKHLEAKESHTYIQSSIGLLFIPLFCFVFLMPFAFKKKEKKELKAMLYLMPIVTFILAFSTYCLAGVCQRYLLDIFPIAAFTSILVIALLIEKTVKKRIFIYLLPVIVAASIISVFITTDILFNYFDGINGTDLNGILYEYKGLFNLNNLV